MGESTTPAQFEKLLESYALVCMRENTEQMSEQRQHLVALYSSLYECCTYNVEHDDEYLNAEQLSLFNIEDPADGC